MVLKVVQNAQYEYLVIYVRHTQSIMKTIRGINDRIFVLWIILSTKMVNFRATLYKHNNNHESILAILHFMFFISIHS